VLQESLGAVEVTVASIEARAKALDSFYQKAITPAIGAPDQPKYPDPITQVTDLAGARVITFFPKTVDQVCDVIESQFTVHERSDKADELRQQERFGYQSVHYLVSLGPHRTHLPEYARFRGYTAEIQVRTILQHAWAEIEHDIQYKSEATIPSSIRRRFMSIAGLLEIADREFQVIQEEDEALRRSARALVEQGHLDRVAITPDALKTYLDMKLGPDGRMSVYSYDWSAQLLLRLGFTNLKQVDLAITPHDDDRLSRIAYSSRLGQITRFELQLLAAMGQEFVSRHMWADESWFSARQQKILRDLAAAGIATGTYVPQPPSAAEAFTDGPAA
jgi:ppGpp synthetase/RelA/SpoT-type nucleotidyltranferase